LLGICCVIEQQRHLNENPLLPIEFENYYKEGLQILKQFVINSLDKNADDTTFRMALATLAVCSGQVKLSKAIAEMEGDTMDEFLDKF
jgi:DNA-binding transcriptional regulator LsrR (DeoR family)